VSIQHGFSFFAVSNEKYAMHSDSSHVVLFYLPKDELTIVCYKTKPDGLFTYDAAFMQRSLKQKYHMK
jgi:hypothetical protein